MATAVAAKAAKTEVQTLAPKSDQATQVSPITDATVKHLQSLATKATHAEEDYKDAFRAALEQILLFQAAHAWSCDRQKGQNGLPHRLLFRH